MSRQLLFYSMALVAIMAQLHTFPLTEKKRIGRSFVYLGTDMSLFALSDPDNWQFRNPFPEECSPGEVACTVFIGNPSIVTNEDLAYYLSGFPNAAQAINYLSNPMLENEITTMKEVTEP